MKNLLIAIATSIVLIPALSMAADKGKKDDVAHVRKDIDDHRAMAEAHSNAARCLESGKPEKDCQAQLAKDCKGLGIGKHCGMKHRH